LTEEKKQQVIALGRLGWSLRRIQQNTGVRRETAASYLRAAGIAFRPPGGWGRRLPPKPANEVITDPAAEKTANLGVSDPARAKPANEAITDFGAGLAPGATAAPVPKPGRSPSASACAPYREVIELGLSRGRNAMAIWQDLVDASGFAAGYLTKKLRHPHEATDGYTSLPYHVRLATDGQAIAGSARRPNWPWRDFYLAVSVSNFCK
jgi:hypothetical protein